MIVERGLEHVQRDPASVVTVGTFDGVHRGHRAIIDYLHARAERVGGRSVVVTFDPHPRAVLTGTPVPLLTTIDERAALLEALGVDRMVVIGFDRAFAGIEPEAYVADVLVGAIGLREIVVGYDHRFGRARRGDRALLERMGAERGFTVDVIPAQLVAEDVVSSSQVRRLLLDGAVEHAAQLLGRHYGLAGTVVPGDGRGAGIGFPTANVEPEHPDKVVPGRGVYAVRVHARGAAHPGMLNIGVRPTFGGEERRVEVHLIDFEGDLYGETIRVEFVARTRDERRFEGVDALVEQLKLDRARCIDLLERVA